MLSFPINDTPQGSLVSGSESLQWMWTAAPSSSSAVGGATTTTTTTAVSSQRGSGGGGLPFVGGAGGAMSVVPIPTVFAPAGSTTSPLLPSSRPLSRDRDESASFPRTDEEGSATRTYRSVSLENGLATASCSKVDEMYPISVLERMKPTDASTTVAEERDVAVDGAVTAMALFLSNHSQEVQDRNQQLQQQQPQQLNGDEKEQAEAGPGEWAGMRPVAVEISPRGGTTLLHPPHQCLDDVFLQNKLVSKSDDELRLFRCQQPTGLPPSDPHHSISNDHLHYKHHHHPHHLHYLLAHHQQHHAILAPDGNNASMSRLMSAVPFCGPPPPPATAITDNAHLVVRDFDAPPLHSATHHHRHPYPYPCRHVGYEEVVLSPPVAARSPTAGSSLGGGRSDLLEEGEGTHTKMSKNDSLPFVPSAPDREGEEKGDTQQEEEEEEPDIATDHHTVSGGPLHCQTSLFPKPLDAAVVGSDGVSDLHLLHQHHHHHHYEEAVTPTAPSSGRRSAPRRASSFSLDLLGSSSSSGSHYADTAEGPQAPACTLALPVYCEHPPPPDDAADMDRPHPTNTPPHCFSSSAEGVAVVKPHPMPTIAEDTSTASSSSSPFPTGKTALERKETHVVGDHHVNDESSGTARSLCERSVLSKGITSRRGFSSHTTAAAGGIPPLVPSSSVSPEFRSGASLRRSTFGFSAMSHPPRSDSSSVKREVGCCSSHSSSRLSVVDVVDLRFSIAASGVLPLSSTVLSSPSSFQQPHRRTSTTPSSPQPPHPTPCISNGNDDDLSMNHNNKNHKNLSLPPASAAGVGGGCEGSLPRPLQNRETLVDDDEKGVELPESPGHRHAFDTTSKQQQQQPHQNQQQLLMAGSWSLCSERLLAAAAGAESLPQQERGATMVTRRRNPSAAVPSNELSHGSLKTTTETTKNEKDDCNTSDVRPILPSCFSSSFSSSSPSSAQVLAGGTKRNVRLPTDCKVSSLDNAGGARPRRQHDVEEMSALLKLMCTPPPPVTRQ